MSKLKKVTALALLVFVILQMFGCAVHLPDPESVSSEDEAAAMGFSAGDYDGKMKVGDYRWLPVNLKIDYQYALKWFSADPEIATVDSSGRVDAKSPGTTIITAKAKKASIEYEITVTKAAEKPLSSSTAIIVDESTIQQSVGGGDILANPYAILVNVKTNCATVYTYNNSGVYSKPVRAMICSVGKGESTTLGSYTISSKERWHVAEDGKYYQYYSGVSNSDVSLALSSVPYKSQVTADLITAEYNKLGTDCTNGDLRFCADDAKWIYDHCVEGTLIKITSTDSKSQDPLGVPEPIRISDASAHKNWDPTDPSSKNPHRKSVPVFEGTEDAYVRENGIFDAYDGVSVFDTCKNKFTDGIQVDGKVPCTLKGTYIITYYFTDAMGRTGRSDRLVHVVSSEEYEELKSQENKD